MWRALERPRSGRGRTLRPLAVGAVLVRLIFTEQVDGGLRHGQVGPERLYSLLEDLSFARHLQALALQREELHGQGHRQGYGRLEAVDRDKPPRVLLAPRGLELGVEAEVVMPVWAARKRRVGVYCESTISRYHSLESRRTRAYISYQFALPAASLLISSRYTLSPSLVPMLVFMKRFLLLRG